MLLLLFIVLAHLDHALSITQQQIVDLILHQRYARQATLYAQEYDKLWQIGSASKHYLQQLRNANSTDILMQTLQHKQLYYFRIVSQQSDQLMHILMDSLSQLRNIHAFEQNNRICLFNTDLLHISQQMYLQQHRIFQQIFQQYNSNSGVAQQTLPIIQSHIKQCTHQVKLKNREITNFRYNIVSSVNSTASIQLIDAIQQFVNCYNYDATQDFIQAISQFQYAVSHDVTLLQIYDALNYSPYEAVCSSEQFISSQLQAGTSNIRMLGYIGQFITNISMYQFYSKLKLPVATIIKLMKAKQTYDVFQNKYQHKLDGIVGQIRAAQTVVQMQRIHYDSFGGRNQCSVCSEGDYVLGLQMLSYLRNINTHILAKFARLTSMEIIA